MVDFINREGQKMRIEFSANGKVVNLMIQAVNRSERGSNWQLTQQAFKELRLEICELNTEE